jgi:hypothetical protein
VKDKDYEAILSSIDEALALFDRNSNSAGSEVRIYERLRELRNTVAQAQRAAGAQELAN